MMNKEYSKLAQDDRTTLFFVDQDVLCSWNLPICPDPQLLQHHLLSFEREYLTYPIVERLLKLHLTTLGEPEYEFFYEMAKALNVIKGVYSVHQILTWCNAIDSALTSPLPQLK
jgi:hypothetical protein